jgi:hypothetical protein
LLAPLRGGRSLALRSSRRPDTGLALRIGSGSPSSPFYRFVTA